MATVTTTTMTATRATTITLQLPWHSVLSDLASWVAGVFRGRFSSPSIRSQHPPQRHPLLVSRMPRSSEIRESLAWAAVGSSISIGYSRRGPFEVSGSLETHIEGGESSGRASSQARFRPPCCFIMEENNNRISRCRCRCCSLHYHRRSRSLLAAWISHRQHAVT